MEPAVYGILVISYNGNTAWKKKTPTPIILVGRGETGSSHKYLQ